ncbi:uncharacterized protein LOC116841520 [Odontomachus brunneus]|uniref:uncharacterized protein LOC116841520 n=1 Tax=Odontomachus brunneus TaxID=486640 RepID=UPI0013F1975B|nr:uncharacterized protein LOC116841520 [Odontomachus brunneus]
MSTNKVTTRFQREVRCIDLIGDEKLLAEVDTTNRRTHIRPHFELHTQSSLMKRKEPKQYTTISLKKSRISEGNRVCKKRSGLTKQSKSLQALKTILREKDSREVFASLSNELIKTVYRLKDRSENSFVPLQNGSIGSAFYDFEKQTERLTKSEVKVDSRDEIVQIGEHLGKSREASFQDGQRSEHSRDIQRDMENTSSVSLRSNWSRANFISIENHPFVETRRGTRLSDNGFEDFRHKIKSHHELKSQGKPEDSALDEEYSVEAQVYRHGVLPYVTCNRGWETWRNERAAIQIEDAGVDHSRECDSREYDLGDKKFVKQVDDIQLATSNVGMSNRKKCIEWNPVSNLQARKPARVNKVSTVENTASLTQKSSRLTMKSIASRSNQEPSKHSSVESIVGESTRVLKSRKLSKLSVKENRDPCASLRINCASKLCKHLVETSQAKDTKQRGMPNEGMLLKKRRSTRKVVCFPSSDLTAVSGKHDDAKPRGLRSRSRSKSRSRRWQSRLATPKNSSKTRRDINGDRIESAPTYKKRSTPSEVMHTLKQIINSSRDNEDVKGNAKISESEEASMSTRTVSTQTLPCCKKNVVEAGCNTMTYEVFYKDAEVSCDLVGSSSSKTDVDLLVIRDELVSEDVSIHTIVGPRLIQYTKTDDESECCDDIEKLSSSINDKTLIGDSTELKSCISAETIATSGEMIDTNRVFVAETKTIMAKEQAHKDEIPFKSSGNHGDSTRIAVDGREELIERLNDYDATGDSACDQFPKSRWIPLSLYDYDASCSDNSEESMEHFEDDVRHDDAVAPELGVNGIPSDVLVAFQLAAKYARNLHQAVLLYNESLMSQESERQSKTVSEDHRTIFGNNRCYVHRSASFLSCKSDGRPKSKRDTEYQLIMTSDEDFDKFSACSSNSRYSLHSHQLELRNFEARRTSSPEINLEEENVILPQRVETSMKLVQKRSDLMLVDVKSFVRLLVHRTPEEHALEVLKLEELVEDGKLEDDEKVNGTAAVFASELVSVILRKHLIPLIYCLFCTLVFWYLQFSFTCNSI